MRPRDLIVALAFAALATGCTGATFGSGVGDRFLDHAPWEAGSGSIPATVGWFSPGYQRGASQPPSFDPVPGPGTPMNALLGDIENRLARRGRPLPGLGNPRGGVAPDVMFGCQTDGIDECVNEEVGRPRLRLAVGRPSQSWVGAAAERMEERGVDAALLITVEVGQYLTRQRDLLGRKEIELGRDHRVRIPWLTSLETPVSVLQLTGALIGRDGRAIRIAAEGLVPRRTGLMESSLGLQALITDEEVERARTARRADLSGSPLVWEVALDHLIESLLGGR